MNENITFVVCKNKNNFLTGEDQNKYIKYKNI